MSQHCPACPAASAPAGAAAGEGAQCDPQSTPPRHRAAGTRPLRPAMPRLRCWTPTPVLPCLLSRPFLPPCSATCSIPTWPRRWVQLCWRTAWHSCAPTSTCLATCAAQLAEELLLQCCGCCAGWGRGVGSGGPPCVGSPAVGSAKRCSTMLRLICRPPSRPPAAAPCCPRPTLPGTPASAARATSRPPCARRRSGASACCERAGGCHGGSRAV